MKLQRAKPDLVRAREDDIHHKTNCFLPYRWYASLAAVDVVAASFRSVTSN